MNNYCCFVCGTHKSECSPKHLEAHEAYDINYETGVARLKEIVALCKKCHTFIHSGRLMSLVNKGIVSEHYAEGVMRRGMKILKSNNLSPTYDSFVALLSLQGLNPPQIDMHLANHPEIQPNPDVVPWDQWSLVLGDQEFKSNFANYEEWKAYYRKE